MKRSPVFLLLSALALPVGAHNSNIEIKILRERLDDLESLVGEKFDVGDIRCTCEWAAPSAEKNQRVIKVASTCAEAEFAAQTACQKSSGHQCKPVQPCVKTRQDRFRSTE